MAAAGPGLISFRARARACARARIELAVGESP
jgi:hypothetical protein